VTRRLWLAAIALGLIVTALFWLVAIGWSGWSIARRFST
jgi:hypothetical protein